MSRLTLKEKVNVIKGLDCGKTQSALSKEFNVSRKTVQNILKRKAELMSSYNENEPADRKRRATCKFSEIDASVWEWFKKMRSQNKPIDGPTIQAKALEFARELRIQEDSFKASNGWLSSWRARHNVTYGSITGEGAAVDLTAVADWKMKIPELTNGYEQKDIYNLDETGLVFRRTPSKTMKIKGEDCKGGKKAKERLTVCLLVNMLGKFETPLVIGKSAHPRAFKHVKSLPVVWRCNKSAWMTSNLFEEMIARFNEKMRREGRHVLLFLDNAPCHPKLTFSNVKLVFFPANMTTHAQPLDQGIIQAMKIHYRKKLMAWLLRDCDNDVAVITKNINVLDACYWISSAILDIKTTTVRKCFTASGFPTTDGDDLFSDDNDHADLAPLLQRWAIDNAEEPCTVSDFVTFDNEVPTTGSDCEADPIYQNDDEDLSEDHDAASTTDTPPTRKQVVESLGTLRKFALHLGKPSIVKQVMDLTDEINIHLLSDSRQTDIRSFFEPQ